MKLGVKTYTFGYGTHGVRANQLREALGLVKVNFLLCQL